MMMKRDLRLHKKFFWSLIITKSIKRMNSSLVLPAAGHCIKESVADVSYMHMSA